MSIAQPFLRVPFALAREVGPDAALLHALVTFRSRGRDGWVATYADIEEAIGLSRWKVAKAAEALQSKSILSIWMVGPGRTFQWQAKSSFLMTQVEDPDLDTMQLETKNSQRTNPTAVAVLDEEDDMDDPTLDLGIPDPEPKAPAKNGATLVARWYDGHRATGEVDPPEPYMRRVRGQCGALARACVTDDDWRAAWIAAYRAGELGKVDPVPLMVKARSQFETRRNYYVDMVKADAAESLGILGIDQSEIER